MAELEKIVANLEDGKDDLPAAMQQFEHGAKLATELQHYLAQAQLKVTTIKAQFSRDKLAQTPLSEDELA